MRIAIISDIHGNLTALETVLEDIKKRNIDKIFCLGDIIAKGINGSQCIDLVKEHCEIVIKGSTDEYFSNEKIEATDEDKVLIDWNRSLLSNEDLEYLRTLPACYEFFMSGKLIRMFHATPNSFYNCVYAVDKPSEKILLFEPSTFTLSSKMADIVIYGHTHTPFEQKLYNRFLINTGSVGNATDNIRDDDLDGNILNTIAATYLIIEGEYNSMTDGMFATTIVSVPYDIAKELAYNKDKNIEYDMYKKELTEGIYRYMGKVSKHLEDKI